MQVHAMPVQLQAPRLSPAPLSPARLSPARTSSSSTTVHLPRRLVASAPTAGTYRRRRLGVTVFVGALVGSFVMWAAPSSAELDTDPGRVSSYTVQPGDTLWGIAERLYPTSDVALVVDAMVALNGDATILAGQQLRLP